MTTNRVNELSNELYNDISNSSNNPCLMNDTELDTKTYLNITFWNIRGIHDKIFESCLQEFLFKNDIIILTESHTDKADGKEYDKIPGFVYKNFPRQFIHPLAPGPSGGIGIFINCNIIDGIEFKCIEECIVWMVLKSTYFGWEQNKLIACTYFSPEDSSYLHSTNARTDYFEILSEQVSNYQNWEDIIICGDLNARTANLSDEPQRVPGSKGGLENLTCHVTKNYDVNIVKSRLVGWLPPDGRLPG